VSFEDRETAAVMKELFVNVKVDREERPDIDAIYMEAVQALTGRGGWPMTVFLTPDGRPFFGGTYFPPSPRYGMPGFRQLLHAIAEAWADRRRELEAAGDRLTEALNRQSKIPVRGVTAFGSIAPRPEALLLTDLLDRAARGLFRSHDRAGGGFGDAPKFPQPMNLDFLLQSYQRTRDETLLQVVTLTLTKMACGGIYDQLGGGFHRYSTDAQWLVPHFEKMLYDNAQLARTYLHTWQVTGEPEFRRVAEETLDYVLREMTSTEGGFYSTQDADSEGQEGKFFLWTPAEVAGLLGPEDARLFCACYDVTDRGNFPEGGPGANILHVPHNLAAVARAQGVTPDRLAQAVARGQEILFAARERRTRPGRDDKILAEWNGLMIHALAETGVALDRPDYLAAAERAAEFVLTKMTNTPSSILLYRSYKDGQARVNAYLEDYAAVALGLLGLYQATFKLRWLEAAAALAQTIIADFHDPAGGGFFQTGADHERLIARRKEFIDNAMPAGNSLAAELFLRLSRLLDRPAYAAYAADIFRPMAVGMAEHPVAFGRLLCALDLYLNPGPDIAVVGEPAAADTRTLLAEVRRRYLPHSVVALRAPGDEAAPALPFLAGRDQISGRATAYVCRNYTCHLPTTDPAALAEQLKEP
jgi:uncharacterized protein YyaL (SSP411 family)